jgi:hypothetical protein
MGVFAIVRSVIRSWVESREQSAGQQQRIDEIVSRAEFLVWALGELAAQGEKHYEEIKDVNRRAGAYGRNNGDGGQGGHVPRPQATGLQEGSGMEEEHEEDAPEVKAQKQEGIEGKDE